ncbi:MAG: cupin domain-containing protein [Pseudomonadota bacterium]
MTDPMQIDNLLQSWRELPFERFRDGVEIHHLCKGEPALAILRYAPGASVPRHLHQGMETILVLDGEQCDERGAYGVGDLVVNPEGTIHSVWSETGCAVLIQWTRPVRMLNEGPA